MIRKSREEELGPSKGGRTRGDAFMYLQLVHDGSRA